jgi:hypothetical protein
MRNYFLVSIGEEQEVGKGKNRFILLSVDAEKK